MMITDLLAKSFLFNLFALARFSHAKKYLLKNIFRKKDPYLAYVLSKNKERSLNIWSLKQIKYRKEFFTEDLYFWEIDGERWLANLDHIHGLYEYKNRLFHDIYSSNYLNKTVLDVGGYIGDSARFFFFFGACRVIIYEPIEKNVLCMKHNLQEYQQAIEIHQKGVAAEDGEMTISSNYPAGHIGFGNREGRYTIKVPGQSFSSLLSKIHVDIAKIDCEGNEKYLLDVVGSDLRKIPYWMIEFHDHLLIDKLVEKFRSNGFEKIAISVPEGHLSMFHFRLRP